MGQNTVFVFIIVILLVLYYTKIQDEKKEKEYCLCQIKKCSTYRRNRPYTSSYVKPPYDTNIYY